MTTPDQIEQWALEAGYDVDGSQDIRMPHYQEDGPSNEFEYLQRFAAKVRAAAIAECVTVAKQWDQYGDVVSNLEEMQK